jgi:hypothetical protein
MKTDAGEEEVKQHKYHSQKCFRISTKKKWTEKLMPLQIRFLFYEHCLQTKKKGKRIITL